MKPSLQKNLFAIIIALGLSIVGVKAQIVYTNVNPDRTFICQISGCTKSYSLDLNNDKTSDFQLTCKSYFTARCDKTSQMVSMTVLDSNQLGTFPLFVNDAIDQSLQWNTVRVQTLASFVWLTFDWPATCSIYHSSGSVRSDAYLGLKLKSGSNIYYGWVRLNISASLYAPPLVTRSSFTIKDYAYNSIPNQPILAGEGAAAIPLPLTLLSFYGILKHNTVELKWKTAIEINNKGFDIERSIDGRNFLSIEFIKAKTNTVSEGNYSFTDYNLIDGINYYRLKQIDYDEHFNYSPVIKINNTNSEGNRITIVPNPFHNSANISFTISTTQQVSIAIYDMAGRLIKIMANEQMKGGSHQVKWNARDEQQKEVSAGIYFLKMQTGDHWETRKIVLLK